MMSQDTNVFSFFMGWFTGLVILAFFVLAVVNDLLSIIISIFVIYVSTVFFFKSKKECKEANESLKDARKDAA